MFKKNLSKRRMEFMWDTLRICTRTTMKGKYEKDKYNCPLCRGGRENGVLETPSHLLSNCIDYYNLRDGVNPGLVLEDRGVFLTRAIKRRK